MAAWAQPGPRSCNRRPPDAKGENVKERPVYPQDLLGSIYELLGIDPAGKLPDSQGRDLRILPPLENGTGKGILKELM